MPGVPFPLWIILLLQLAAVRAIRADVSPAIPQTGASSDASILDTPSYDFRITREYEPGVENRLLGDYVGTYLLSENWTLRADFAVSALQQSGLSLMGGELSRSVESLHSRITLGLQQERWSDWQVTENRAELFWTFGPWHRVHLTLGLSYRAPQYQVASIAQSLGWPSNTAELGLLYDFTWSVFESRRWRAQLGIGDYERMRLYTPDNIHVEAEAAYRWDANWSTIALISLGLKGFSGAVAEFSQSILGVGARYEP